LIITVKFVNIFPHLKNKEKRITMEEEQSNAGDQRWDLSFLYSGLDDPQIDADIKSLVQMAENFHACHKGKLAETLGKAIFDYQEIKMLENKVMVYLFLTQSTDVANSAVKAKIAAADKTLSQAFGEYLAFWDIELVALSEAELTRLYDNDPLAAKHRPWLEHARTFKPNLLSESVESALTKRSSFGPSAWSEFYDELCSDLKFEFNGQKKNLEAMLHGLSQSKDSQERAQLLQVINRGLKGAFAKYAAQTLYMVVGSKAVEDKERCYRHPMEARNKSNRIPDAVVNALHNSVEDIGGPLARRYYRLKAAHLGLKTLRWSDRNAPMPFSDTTVVPFSEAMKTVLEAYQSFSPKLAEMVRSFSENKRIDVPATKGKRGGAFNYSVVLPERVSASFIFLNYLGSSRDVMTLAHELGHGVHGLLAGKEQGVLMSHAPIAYCETASVFGEMTTFNFLQKALLEKGDGKSRLALLMGKIDDMINTVVRQIGFSNFERRLHGLNPTDRSWSEPQKLSPEELSAIWLETLKRLYGEEGEVFTYENTENLWTYIPHFHNPFYVYGYAFGELLTQSLHAQQAEMGDRFEPLYLDMLRSGSTKNVVELLKPFGLDPRDENFWANGANMGLGAMIKDAEQLSRSMGVSI